MKLMDYFTIRRPSTTSREFFDKHEGVMCVHYGDIYRNYSGRRIDSSNIINKFNLNINPNKLITEDSIILPDVTETISDYGHSTYINFTNTPYLNGTHTIAIINKSNQNLKYLYYYLQSPINIKRMQTLLLGSTVFQISIKEFNNFELLNFHNNEIQQHIVDIRRCCYVIWIKGYCKI